MINKKQTIQLALLAGLIFIAFSGCTNSQNTGLVIANQSNASDSIEIKGSDTTLQLVSNMAEEFAKQNPGAKISVTGGGSGTGIASLLNGEIFIANSSRQIKEEELAQAQQKGMEVFEIIIGRDTLSIIVHSNNPIEKLTVEQIAKIYRGEITNWKEVGGQDKEITLFGRQTTSGTYVFFQEHVLKGDYSPKMRNMEGTQAIVDAVKQDETGIGYAGAGYVIDEKGQGVQGVKLILVAIGESFEYISVLDKAKILEYPISRELFQYVAKANNPEIKKFVEFELSQKGQQIVKETGFDQITTEEENKNSQYLKKI